MICFPEGPAKVAPRTTVEERFLTHIRRLSNGCWVWTGAVDPDGYGRLFLGRVDGRAKIVFAHRWSYTHYVGPIPDGMVIDHIAEICDHPNCVNPRHLQAVKRPVQVRRRKTVCGHGHDMEDLGRRRDGTCAECARQRLRAYRARRKTSETSET